MYWGISPEVNAFRLTMAGAGPTAHVPQVTAFETAAITHTQQATQMAATAAATAASFVGAGGQSMMQCAAVQSTWMSAAGAFAQKTAGTIGAGINAYGSAVAATIPVPTVVANRVREATLQATNIIGQNAIPIAESNFEYGEFWAQNAGAMMGYLTAITGLVGSLVAPLPVLPGAANPAAAAAAGVAATGMSLGLQGAGVGLSGAAQAGTAALSAGTGAVTSGAGAVAAATSQGAQGAQAGQSGTASSGAPAGAQQADPSQALQSAQGMMGPLMSAPSMAASSMGQLLSQAQQLPSQMGGQLSGLLSPALSAAGGAFGGGGTPGLAVPRLGAAGGPWSGLGGGSGGFAGGGSPVSAALTKPSAGAGMTGSVGMPSAWWNNANGADKTAAGVRGASGPMGTGPMAPGMYGMPGGAGAGSQRKNRDVADADKSVLVDDGVGDGVPVYTDDGVVYVQGQGV
ncbi:PPE domain-containing protein [Mycobacterium sp. CVI_P3]|uniref:PPE domain-containing protein n=1 Tax=Mycobacterium pinniadriaticum TaxID=2994102 RepID=A0ABT3SFR0_9MYCO|nr:PPE domain-containing protein [Mycobacterium pinniadriaticum]MCX2931708.1 PPE domain-containing protein [Mycobacterium pinniadriaticum]MCX2938217.1 PPE domain-containing protein [Mycobacterium pinniadriaticum]